MNTIVVPGYHWPAISHREPAGRESAGIALARELRRSDGSIRWLISRVLLPSADDYVTREPLEAVLSPTFVAASVAEAKRDAFSVIFFHTHPFTDSAQFSGQDDSGERVLAEFMQRRIPSHTHAALVIGRHNHAARILGTDSMCSIEIVGEEIERFGSVDDTQTARAFEEDTFDRQVRVFGRVGQDLLAKLRIAVVGLGGTGSVVAQELAHLGVRHFLLVDPDVVDPSNLNRVVGAKAPDVGRPKVEVAADMILTIRPDATVEAVHDSILLQNIARRVAEADAVFGCTDSHGSRHVLNQLAYQYLVPVFDTGVVIAISKGTITHIFGRAQMLSAGLPCLTCTRTLDPQEIRRDLLSDYERKLDPYIVGGVAPQPAVISINATVSSLAVSLFLSAFTHIPIGARNQLYDAMRGMVRPVGGASEPNCVTCSPAGAFAQADAWPPPGRTAA